MLKRQRARGRFNVARSSAAAALSNRGRGTTAPA
jgi:hypothetical protein